VALGLLWKRRQERSTQTFTYLALLAFLFQLPIALLIWRHLPEMAVVAFPFRFLPLMGAALPLVLLARGTSTALRKPAYILIALLTLIPFLEHARTQLTASTRTPRFAELAERWRAYGYEGMPEFVPPGVTRPSGPLNLPLVTAVDTPPGSNCVVAMAAANAGGFNFSSMSDVPCKVRLGVYFYPYWRATDQNGKSLHRFADADSLLLVDVPAGSHIVHVVFAPRSRTRTIAAGISSVALLLLGLALALVRPARSSEREPAWAA
jgi:hypothetical protein